MKRSLILVGLLLFTPVRVEGATLYQSVRESVRKELMVNPSGKLTVQKNVARFVAESLAANEPQVKDNEMDAVLRREYTEICSAQASRKAMNYGQCTGLMSGIRGAILMQETLRNLGRDLQAIATSYEVMIDGYPGRSTTLPSRYASLVLLWRAGTNTVLADPSRVSIRMATLPKGTAWDDAVEALKNDLNNLEGDERTAAVWRYQHGVRYVQGKRVDYPLPPPVTPDTGPGTERQFQTHRWDGAGGTTDIEGPLGALFSLLVGKVSEEKAPLLSGEVVFFPVIEMDDAIAWGYVEVCQNPNAPGASCMSITLQTDPPQTIMVTGDVGLQWETPLEPTPPALIALPEASCGPPNTDCPAIGGGHYPPDPVDGTGLCTFPFARSGYLCRPVPPEGDSICENTPKREPGEEDAVILTRCDSGARYQTEQGPNICRDVLWRNNPDKDQAAQKCVNCTVNLVCKADCNGQVGMAYMKKDDGSIEVCIKGSTVRAPYRYTVIHELVHAQQYCSKPPETPAYTDLKGCCLREKEAFAISCQALTDDGLFAGSDITTEYCATAMTDDSCTASGFGSCANTPQEEITRVFDTARANAEASLQTCEESIDPATRDPRIQAMLDGLLNVSKAECETTYQNTIGNTMCYVGQMMEETYEEKRTIPGRSPFLVQDQAYPWDSCAAPDPALATFLTPPPKIKQTIPAYRPLYLVKQYDQTLCQINGLPPGSLPIECGTDALRVLTPLSPDFVDISQRLKQQTADRLFATERFQGLGESIGARVGTMLYVRYLERASKSLEEVISMAVKIFTDLTTVKFTKEMCPRAGSFDEALHNYSVCPQ